MSKANIFDGLENETTATNTTPMKSELIKSDEKVLYYHDVSGKYLIAENTLLGLRPFMAGERQGFYQVGKGELNDLKMFIMLMGMNKPVKAGYTTLGNPDFAYVKGCFKSSFNYQVL